MVNAYEGTYSYSEDFISLGDTFMRSYYTTLDFGGPTQPSQIGFGPTSNQPKLLPAPSPSSSSSSTLIIVIVVLAVILIAAVIGATLWAKKKQKCCFKNELSSSSKALIYET